MAYRCSLLIDSQGQAQPQWRLANSLSDTPAEQCVSCDVAVPASEAADAIRRFRGTPTDSDEMALVWVRATVTAEDGRVSVQLSSRRLPLLDIIAGVPSEVVLDGPVHRSGPHAFAVLARLIEAGGHRLWAREGSTLVRATELSADVSAGPATEAQTVVAATRALRGGAPPDVHWQGGAENVGYTSGPGNEEEFFVRTTRPVPGGDPVVTWSNSAGRTCDPPQNPWSTDLWIVTDGVLPLTNGTIFAYGMAWRDASGRRQERWRTVGGAVAIPACVYWYGGTGGVVGALNTAHTGGISDWKARFPTKTEYAWSGTGESTTSLLVASSPGARIGALPVWKVSTHREVNLFLSGAGWDASGKPMASFGNAQWSSVSPGFDQITLRELDPVVLELLDGAGTLTVYPAL